MAHQKVIMFAVAGVAVVVIGAIALLSGKTEPKREKVIVHRPTTVVQGTMDFYAEGMRRGFDWKSKMANRQMSPTPDEVEVTADRMTADYSRKGITADGERRFKDGFKKAVLGN